MGVVYIIITNTLPVGLTKILLWHKQVGRTRKITVMALLKAGGRVSCSSNAKLFHAHELLIWPRCEGLHRACRHNSLHFATNLIYDGIPILAAEYLR